MSNWNYFLKAIYITEDKQLKAYTTNQSKLRQVIILTNHWLIKEKLIGKLKIILIFLNCPNLVTNMNTTEAISSHLVIPEQLFLGHRVSAEYIWKNPIIKNVVQSAG